MHFFGGYLILNHLGRPLEFHCTAPIIANRAQEILYGPTLRPFLFGEQIGRTLVERAKIKPRLLCVDRTECFAVREYTDAPTVLVLDEQSNTAGNLPLKDGNSCHTLGINRVVLCPEDADRASDVTASFSALVAELDLTEPFSRIREAIEEARRGGAAA